MKEILYFDKPDRQNIDEIIKVSIKRAEDLGIHKTVLAWSSGYTTRKFMELSRQAKYQMDITVVTNAKGAIMPYIISVTDNAETRKWKEEQIKRGIKGTIISISDDTRRELEKEGVKGILRSGLSELWRTIGITRGAGRPQVKAGPLRCGRPSSPTRY